jgi:hypothetical protein
MTRLSACYFCGTALDDPLDEHPVVPSALRGDDPDPTTVTLCDPCHDKLDAIVATVTDAVADAPADAADATARSEAPEKPERPDDVLVDHDPPVGGSGPILSDPDDGATESAGGPEAASAGAAGEDPLDESDSQAAEPTTGADETDPTGDDPGSRDTPTAPTDESAAAGDSDDQAGDPAPAGGSGEQATTPAAGDDGDDGERSVVEGDHSISALEYNKVMRLLQNREFPVDRDEIEVVAANAYQVARSDCATVIDVAVDRGLIEEVDGQLRKPDNA